MKKSITWYQLIEIVMFISALVLCIVIGVRVNIKAQAIADQIYETNVIEGLAIAMICGVILNSKFYAIFVLAAIVTVFSIIGIAVNKNARFLSIDYVIFAVSAICTIICLICIIHSIVNGGDVKNKLQALGEVINIAFRCGFNMPINTGA